MTTVETKKANILAHYNIIQLFHQINYIFIKSMVSLIHDVCTVLLCVPFLSSIEYRNILHQIGNVSVILAFKTGSGKKICDLIHIREKKRRNDSWPVHKKTWHTCVSLGVMVTLVTPKQRYQYLKSKHYKMSHFFYFSNETDIKRSRNASKIAQFLSLISDNSYIISPIYFYSVVWNTTV